jgi:hypothetical protein
MWVPRGTTLGKAYGTKWGASEREHVGEHIGNTPKSKQSHKSPPPLKRQFGFIIGFRVYYRGRPCLPRASLTWKFCSLEAGGPKIRRCQWELAFTSVIQCDKGFSHTRVLWSDENPKSLTHNKDKHSSHDFSFEVWEFQTVVMNTCVARIIFFLLVLNDLV